MKRAIIISLTVMLALFGTLHATAYNLTGRITCDGTGVAGVAVSDGYEVVLTDADGRYNMTSNKHNGYVFYSLPGGYEPELRDGFMPQFWTPLFDTDLEVLEVHDFALRRVDNTRHIVLFGADTHLARRYSDRALFKKGFIASLKDEATRADNANIPIYSVLLGDLTWDIFWTQNDYSLYHYMADMRSWGYPMTLWPVIGNHDHDPSVPEGEDTDFEASSAWRDIVCPNYYSFNLGKVHYVVLDDINYLNMAEPGEDYPAGVVGSRNYRGVVGDEQIAWLRKDLALVDYSTPVVVCFHMPAWAISNSFGYYSRLDNTYTLGSILKPYHQVHLVSGHTHGNYTVHPYSFPSITEHNIAAVCGTLWLTASLTGHNVCHDGSAAGYSRWIVDGKTLRWSYRSTGNGDDQMRVYDMNTVRDFYRTNRSMRAILSQYPSRVDFSNIEDNTVMVNVFAYDTDWRVSICEGNTQLPCYRLSTEDPFHTITYDVPQWSLTGYYSTYYTSSVSTHMFQAFAATDTLPITVRVVDSFGNVYLKSITRPHTFSASMENLETVLATGDVNADGEVNIADVNVLIDIILAGTPFGCPPVLADCNGDDEVNIADINRIIDIILKP